MQCCSFSISQKNIKKIKTNVCLHQDNHEYIYTKNVSTPRICLHQDSHEVVESQISYLPSVLKKKKIKKIRSHLEKLYYQNKAKLRI